MRRGGGVYARDIRSKGPLTSDHRPLCLERPLILPEEGGKPGHISGIGGQGRAAGPGKDACLEVVGQRLTLGAVQDGIGLFILGLGSKVLLANSIGALWNDVAAVGFANVSTASAWLALIAFTLQIYFDFSGYSLMAIGMGKALGFTFPQNFNYPYISRSVTEFWRRWHMTLSGWFRDYVYIPVSYTHLTLPTILRV